MKSILLISILLISFSVDAQKKAKRNKSKKQETEVNQVDEQYKKLIEKANVELYSKDYKSAAAHYQEAVLLKPTEPYPKNQLDIVKHLMDEEQRILAYDQMYSKLINLADSEYYRKSYNTAKDYYQRALAIKPNEQYPKEQLNVIYNEELLLVGESYKKLINAGNARFEQQEYLKAKEYYTRAIAIRPSDPYPKQKLEEIETIFTSQKVESERKTTFNKLISEADSLFTLKRYPEAKNKYTEALALEPSAMYPKQKLQEVSNIMASTDCGGDEKQIKYDKLITEGDYLFKNKSYDQAKFKYQEALQIKATQYPKDKILEIQQINNDTRAKQAEYHKLIKEADTFLLNKYYEQALLKYEEAVKIDPTVNYPKAKISEITAILKEDH